MPKNTTSASQTLFDRGDGTKASAVPSAGTTSQAGILQIDGTAADFQPAGVQAAGSTGLAADAGHAHPSVCWTPADSGLLAMNYDAVAAGTTQLMTAGTLYLMRLNFYQAATITNIVVAVTTAGNNTNGSTGTFAGVYNSSGTLLSGSSDVAASLTSQGTRVLALTTPQAVAAGSFVWAALLANLGTTQPTLAKTGASSQASGVNLAAASLRFAVNGTSLTSLPASITPGSNTATGSQPLWVGAS